MKNKRMVLLIAGIAILLVIGAWAVPTLLFGTSDETIENYKRALAESIQGEYFHYTQEEWYVDEDGQVVVNDVEDYYKLGAERLRISKYEDSEYHDLAYNGSQYEYYEHKKDDEVGVNKRDSINPTSAQPNRLDQTYYSIDNRYVTYVETEEQYIVTYVNHFRIGKKVNSSLEEEKYNTYTDATSIAYFDKEWNIQKLEVTESWDSITEEGKEYIAVRKFVVTYHDTSKEEMKNLFEKEYTYFESLLE